MAFQSRDLSVLAYANGFTLWHYRTDDDIEVLLNHVDGSESARRGYFDPAGELLRSGDQIIVNLLDRGGVAIANLAVTGVESASMVRVAPIPANGPSATA